LKVGETLELAIWLNGEETVDHVQQWKHDCKYIMERSFEGATLKLSPLRFEVLRPGNDRVPPVPDDIQGQDVRLLVAEAEVLDISTVVETSFLLELTKTDLERLRTITRRGAGKHIPDEVCDEIIEELGPTMAMRALRESVLH
jgi:hypothetical protein